MFKLTMNALVASLESTVAGTCTFADYGRDAVRAAVYNAISNEIATHVGLTGFWALARGEHSQFDVLVDKVTDQFDIDAVWDEAHESWAGSGFGLCPTCGWWDETLTYEVNGETVCGDCAEEAE